MIFSKVVINLCYATSYGIISYQLENIYSGPIILPVELFVHVDSFGMSILKFRSTERELVDSSLVMLKAQKK